MGSGDCAESKLRPVTMHRENIFLARLENTGDAARVCQHRKEFIDDVLVTDYTSLPERHVGGWGVPGRGEEGGRWSPIDQTKLPPA